MVVMTKEEARNASRIWAANVKQPIDRDAQIAMMKAVRERQQSAINRLTKKLEDERKGQ
jgi:hypothetical protein